MSKTADQVHKAPTPKPLAASPISQSGELDTPQAEVSALHHPTAATPPPVMRSSSMLALQRRVGNQAVQQMLDKKKRSIRQQAESALQTRGGERLGKQEAATEQREDAVKALASPAEQSHSEQAPSQQKPQPDAAAERASALSQPARGIGQPEQGSSQNKASPNALPSSPVAAIKQAAGDAAGGAVSKTTSTAKASPVIKAAAALATATKAAGAPMSAAAPAPTVAEPAPAQAVAPEAPAMAGADADPPAAAAEDPALEEAAALSQQVESPLPQADYSAALDSVGESVGGVGGGGGGGGGGAAIANKPVPLAPNVASAAPAQAMAAMQGLPPLQLQAALTGVSSSAANFVDKEQAQLAAQPPQMQRPSGAHAQHGAPATRPDLPDPKGDAKVERAPEGKATPVAQPKPLPTAPPNPAQRAAPPTDTKDLPASISNIPTTDSGMALKAGPAPTVELTGNADPNKTEEQQAKLLSSVQKTHGEGKADAAQPMGENDIFPVVPVEMLKADVPGGAGAGAAGKAHAAVGAAADMDDQGVAVSAIAQEQSGPAIQAAVAKAQGEIGAKQQEHATKVTSERNKSSQEIDQLIVDNSSAQTTERTKALSDVQQQRSHWNQEQTKLVTDAQNESTKAKAEGLKTIQQEQSQADQEAARHIEQGNAEAAEAQRQGEQEAKQEQERGKSEANSGGFFGWIASKAQGFFDGIKQAIKAAIDKARALVRSVIEKAKQLAVAVIEKARQAVVAVIRKVGDTLIAIGDRVLAGFPALRDKFRTAIKSVVQKAEQAVNALADKLKDNVKKALDKIAKTIDSALSLLETGLMAVVDGVKSVVAGAIKAAKAYISALGAFAAIIGDIVPNPGQWLSNLGRGANDGVRNHLWNAFQNQVKAWFQTKVEQVLGLGQSVWTLLKKGGITLAQIGSMVWQALQAMIPEILRDLLIEKLVSMIVPAAGTVKLIIEGLQAAWGSIGSILQAIDQFVKFLKAVKGGNSGPAFAGALAAAAVAVIDFVSNWLLQRLQNKAVNTVGKKIRALADKIAGGVQTAVKATKQLGSKAASKLKSVFGGKHVDVDAPHAPRHSLDADGRHGANKHADADSETRKQQDRDQDKQRRWRLGLAAVQALPAQSRSEITFALGRIKSAFGFSTLSPVDVGNQWQVKAVMRTPLEGSVTVPEKEEQGTTAVKDQDQARPSGKKWDDPTLTQDEFIADYKARYPKTDLSDEHLIERFNQGDRLNPTTGHLKNPDGHTRNQWTDPTPTKEKFIAEYRNKFPNDPQTDEVLEEFFEQGFRIDDGKLKPLACPTVKQQQEVRAATNDPSAPHHTAKTTEKGDWGEKQVDDFLAQDQWNKAGSHSGPQGTTGQGKPQGIDGVYMRQQPDGSFEYIVVETKYNTSDIGKTVDYEQMSETWIEDRLIAAVGAKQARKIRTQGYKRVIMQIMPDGRIVRKDLDR